MVYVGYLRGREDYALRLDFDDLAHAHTVRRRNLELLTYTRAQNAHQMIGILSGQKSSIA